MNLDKIWDKGGNINPEEEAAALAKNTEKAIMEAQVIFLIKGIGFKYGV
jgi:hypothetical protein